MTPQQIKAMKLALEALKEAQTNDDGMEKWDRNKKAITAIKEALAEHAMREVQRLGQEIEQCNYPDCKCPTENPCLKGLAQPEQEPCVHAKNPKGCYRVRCQVGDKCVDDEMSFRTTPPQPEQEPLAHWSDCAVHSEPAYPKSECDCGGIVAVADYTALSDKYVALSDKYVALKAQHKEQEPVAWLLTDKNINLLQVDSIQRLINRLNHAHHTDLCVRINGQDEWFQADWLKHMVRATPPQRKPLTDEEIFALENSIPDEVVSDRDWCIHFARAIEAAHGIKENQ